MLRNLLRSFEKGLKLHATANTAPWHCNRRLLFSQYENQASPSKSLLTSAALGGNEADNDYVPYRQDLETGTKARVLIETLRERFRFTDDELQRIMSDELVHRTYRSRSLALTLDTLQLEGVSRRSFVEYPWLLSLDDSESNYLLSFLVITNIFHQFRAPATEATAHQVNGHKGHQSLCALPAPNCTTPPQAGYRPEL